MKTLSLLKRRGGRDASAEAVSKRKSFLFPPALEDWVPLDYPARFLREFVDQLDLPALGFVIASDSEGRPPYAPSLLLKIWLYGYFHCIRSTRKLEAACCEHLSLIWLAGLIAPMVPALHDLESACALPKMAAQPAANSEKSGGQDGLEDPSRKLAGGPSKQVRTETGGPCRNDGTPNRLSFLLAHITHRNEKSAQKILLRQSRRAVRGPVASARRPYLEI